MVFLMQAS